MDKFTRKWIIETGVPIVKSYGGNLTLRALHYRLVAKGMTNTLQHYKRVVTAMIDARWDGLVEFSDFLDHREMLRVRRSQMQQMLIMELKKERNKLRHG